MTKRKIAIVVNASPKDKIFPLYNDIFESSLSTFTSIQRWTLINLFAFKVSFSLKNARSYQSINKIKPDIVKRFKHNIIRYKLHRDDLIPHGSLLTNLSSSDPWIDTFSTWNVINEFLIAWQLGVHKINFHIGTNYNWKKGFLILKNNLKLICGKLKSNEVLILENSSGKGNTLGRSSIEMIKIYESVPYKIWRHIAFCIDTCHAFSSGEDPLNMINNLLNYDRWIIQCIHLNDSKCDKGSTKDRHEVPGIGKINFIKLLKILFLKHLKDIVYILELPAKNYKMLNMQLCIFFNCILKHLSVIKELKKIN